MLNMKKPKENKFLEDFPWLACLIWNLAVLGAGCFMIIHEKNLFYALMGLLITWPAEEDD